MAIQMIPIIISIVEIISVKSDFMPNDRNHIINNVILAHIKYKHVFFLFLKRSLSFIMKLITKTIAIKISIRKTRTFLVSGSSVALMIFMNVIMSIAIVLVDIFHIFYWSNDV